MPDGMGETLRSKAGPLPVWSWAVVGVIGVAGILYYRQKKAAATANTQDTTGTSTGGQSNLGSVPISNLSTSAQPMPIQMGDTFVDVQNQTTPDVDKSTPQPGGAAGGPPTTGKVAPLTPAPAKKSSPAPTPAKAPTTTPAKTTTVTTCPWPAWCGSLSGIAQHEWGNASLWPAIYKANQAKIGANPNLIHVGVVLTIPAKPS